MNIDWIVVSVISSVVAMIIGSVYFVYFVMKKIDEEKSDD